MVSLRLLFLAALVGVAAANSVSAQSDTLSAEQTFRQLESCLNRGKPWNRCFEDAEESRAFAHPDVLKRRGPSLVARLFDMCLDLDLRWERCFEDAEGSLFWGEISPDQLTRKETSLAARVFKECLELGLTWRRCVDDAEESLSSSLSSSFISDLFDILSDEDARNATRLVELCLDIDLPWEQCFEDAERVGALGGAGDLNGPQTCIIGGGDVSYCFPEADRGVANPIKPLRSWQLLLPRSLWTDSPFDRLSAQDWGG